MEISLRNSRAQCLLPYFSQRKSSTNSFLGRRVTTRPFTTMLNREIDRICSAVAVKLQRAGYRAYPIAASDYRPAKHAEKLHWLVAKTDDVKALPKIGHDIIGVYSHRLAAVRAGLGWIGKSCSIINPEVGPRLRLGTVLTDAPFAPDSPIDNRCGGCHLCMDACPVHALQGRPFDPSEPLEMRFDAKKCYDFWMIWITSTVWAAHAVSASPHVRGDVNFR